MVTQGHNGDLTHKLDWAYAWDFEMQDQQAKRYAEDENTLSDYYAFSKPVYVSAAGYVVKVLDGVIDNPIGEVNTRENWGNYLCISHGYGLYSFYAHLKKGSLQAKIGDYLKQGDRIGLVGNSGRAALPHLHFQIQLGSEAGSRTRLSHLVNYKLITENRELVDNTNPSEIFSIAASSGQTKRIEFVGSGIPKKDDIISPLLPEQHLQNILGLQNLTEQSLNVTTGKSIRQETWKVELDFWGNFEVVSSRGSRLGFSVFNGVFNTLSLTGNRNSALAAFALLISRLPYSEKQELIVCDEPALSVVLNPVWRQIVLLFSPLFSLVSGCAQSYIKVSKDQVLVDTSTYYRFMGVKVTGFHGKLSIDKYQGLCELSLFKGKRLLLQAKKGIISFTSVGMTTD